MNNVTSILNFIREFFEIPVLEIDENNMDAVLTAFEREHCISPELQTPLTKEYLKAFFSRQKEQNIYNLQDKTGAHIIVIPLFSQWILIGPYMEEDPSSSNNISHYKTLNPFSVMKAVDIMIHEITPENTLYRHEYLRPPKPSGLEEPEEYMEKFYETDLPHSYEQQYMAGLRSGDYETSLYYWEKICRKKPHVDFLRSIKDNAMTILSSYFLILSQLAAREAGLSDEYITELAKRYGEKLYATTDETTIHILTEYMIGELCLEIRKSKKKNHNVYIRRAISYIEKKLSQPLSLEDIAQSIGLSKTYLSKIFKEETGMTVMQYMTQERLERAKRLLEETDFLIQDISRSVGYLDENYFVKVFRKRFRLSPSEYRKYRRAD